MTKKEMNPNSVDAILSRMSANLDAIQESIGRIEKEIADIKEKYVTVKEFVPVRAIAYGFVGAVLSAFVTGLIYLLVK